MHNTTLTWYPGLFQVDFWVSRDFLSPFLFYFFKLTEGKDCLFFLSKISRDLRGYNSRKMKFYPSMSKVPPLEIHFFNLSFVFP